MSQTKFETNPRALDDLLREAEQGKLQLPDFQRSWVWDEHRIVDLLVSVARDFPIGAIMTLKTGGEVHFQPRPIHGVPVSDLSQPEELLLDGQQRMTSLYQATKHQKVVETTTTSGKPIKRWFYISIKDAIDPDKDMADAFHILPENKKITKGTNEAFPDGLDLATQAQEFEQLMFPVRYIFDWSAWQTPLITYFNKQGTFYDLWEHVIVPFEKKVIATFKAYHIPVIALSKTTSKEAVCTVFEKVNTGGKELNAFELVTSIFAANGHNLRDDWHGNKERRMEGYQHQIERLGAIGEESKGVLANVENTDFLHVVSLFHTRALRQAAEKEGKQGKDLPEVTGKRAALLNLSLDAYQNYKEQALDGFKRAANFLHELNIFRADDIPYKSQITAIAAILADMGNKAEHDTVKRRLEQWFWCGVFGELYGSSVDTRISNDFVHVPAWIKSREGEPKTITDAYFMKERLLEMQTRRSAAYKGVHILFMKKGQGAIDWRSGQPFSQTSFFDEHVDIHHVFPQDWCKKNNIKESRYQSIVNKTPLSARTNRILGGDAPSVYLARLEQGTNDAEGIESDQLNKYLRSHEIDPQLLRTNDFAAFMNKRQTAIDNLIQNAMGKSP